MGAPRDVSQIVIDWKPTLPRQPHILVGSPGRPGDAEHAIATFQQTARDRKQLILDRLRRDGRIVAKAMSQELHLSEDTIHKDLRELAHEGRLQRIHGGALPASPAVADYASREQLATTGKAAIGRAAAHLVEPDTPASVTEPYETLGLTITHA